MELIRSSSPTPARKFESQWPDHSKSIHGRLFLEKLGQSWRGEDLYISRKSEKNLGTKSTLAPMKLEGNVSKQLYSGSPKQSVLKGRICPAEAVH